MPKFLGSFKVKIVQCSGQDYWYAEHIGETFVVDFSDRPGKYAVVGQSLGNEPVRFIDHIDADMVTEAAA